MEHKGTVRLETQRLILRPFVRDDCRAIYENWASDKRVTEFLRWEAHDDVSVTEKVLGYWITGYKDPAFYQWAIVLKSLGEPIGTISVVDMDEKNRQGPDRLLHWRELVAAGTNQRSISGYNPVFV